MKIGVFDSGLGGLVITKALREALPEYDYVYYGDTAHLPYGEKDSALVLSYTIEAMKYLISRKCGLIIIACNTATAIALRYLQQKFMPSYAPDVKVLGVVIPTVEEALLDNAQRVGVLATKATVRAHIYEEELHKIKPELEVFEIAAPKLVPLIEANDFTAAKAAAKEYTADFKNIDSLILGCTHYPLLKKDFREFMPENVRIVSQDDLMGQKLKDYLRRHVEIDICLSRNAELEILVSQMNDGYQKVAGLLFPNVEVKGA
ncbi:MAG: glutamate racemase [Alphaproteobacteria bacterium]|nr:glutamate racemase [Alphaproteobacteria bacterium]